MPIHCAVNPTLYRYSQEPYEISEEPKNVGYAMDYINGYFKSADGKKAVVIGGGITGAEVALELAYEGKEVTIVEMMDHFLDPKVTVVPAYYRELDKYQVSVITGKRLESVQGNKAVIVDRFGNQTELEADTVVIAAGFLPDKQPAEAIEAETEAEVITVGDCNKARQIIDAVHEGYAAARYLLFNDII